MSYHHPKQFGFCERHTQSYDTAVSRPYNQIVMNRRIHFTFSNQPVLGSAGLQSRPTLVNRLKIFFGGLLLAAMVAAILIAAVVLGSVIAALIGILLVAALVFVIVRATILGTRA